MSLDRTNPDSWPFAMNRKDVHEVLGVNVNRVDEIFHREDFPKIILGRRFIVTKPAFLAWLERESQKEGLN